MKIIEEGTPNQWSLVVRCTGKGNEKYGCGAQLEIQEADLKRTYMSCMGRYEEDFITIKCPCCGKHTDIEDKHFPSSIYNKVMKQKIYVPGRD